MENKKIKANTIDKIIRYWAKECPNKIILESHLNERCSFRQLNERSVALQKKLNTIINKKTRVALIMSQGYECTLLAVILARYYVVLPLSPACGMNEYKDYFRRFGINSVFVDSKVISSVINLAKKHNISVLRCNKINSTSIDFEVLHQTDKKFSTEKKLKNKKPVFILPTSGTTSIPKIVLLSSDNVFHSARNICRHLKLSKKDSCLNPMPLFHVHGLMVVISSIFVGGKIICLPKYDSDLFFQCLNKFKPTWYTASAGIQENILLKAKNNKKILKNVGLRFIRSSSAPLPAKTTQELEEIFKAPVIESYGMTEAVLQITSQPLPPKKRKLGSCGQPAGVDLIIIDNKNKLLGVNEIGEIAIKGKSVITEYEDNAQENKKSFWNGWFKTGDLGYLDTDNFLFIKGRIKEMINKGGENISPREVDEVLMSHPAIHQAVAFSMPHKTLGEDLAAAIIMKKGFDVSEKELAVYLRAKININKIPSRFYFVDDVPRTAVGKPMRVGLYDKLKKNQKKNITAKSAVERTLLKIWEEILKTKISLADNFFEIGGDSISAQEMIQKMAKQKILITFSDIQDNPTLERLSKYVIKNNYRKDE